MSYCDEIEKAKDEAVKIVKKSAMLERERLNILLFNAVDLLLNDGYTRAKIMEELGMTEKEFEAIGEE